MGQEGVKVKDSLTIRLYDKNGKLISTSRKQLPLHERVLLYLLSILEDSS